MGLEGKAGLLTHSKLSTTLCANPTQPRLREVIDLKPGPSSHDFEGQVPCTDRRASRNQNVDAETTKPLEIRSLVRPT
jgi:hypothetical protein